LSDARAPRRPWLAREPGQLVGRGHPAGDFLEAYLWRVVERRPGYLKVDAHLPDHARNPRGQLFGGFTPTYVDLVSLFAARTGQASESDSAPQWLATTNMRVDYFDPVTGPRFFLECRIVRERGRTVMIETRFLDPADGKLLVFALTTLRRVARATKLGDG
jgi:acyl-coenzyme A thioesterase PaaI-like protein